mmetsp:Transcript_162838/g.312771  ORF Transcript_162838/g.312771 Transcript_162838/m.312771 type:complete len:340 (-) Transcript_162838:833-1852(-)
MSAGSVAFRHAVDERWAVPVKNTFISFDNPLALPTACLRSSTCPPLYRLGGFLTQDDITWESATQELCHCMAPRRPSRGRAPLAPVAVEQCSTVAASSDNAQAVESSETSAPLSPVACDAMASKSNTRELVEGPKEVVSACSKGKGAPDREGEADAMSEVSTKESEGSLERGKSSTVQQWTSVLSKSKKSKGAGCVESRGKHGDTSPPANGRASRARGEQQGSGRGAQAVDAPQSPTAAAPVTPKGYGKGKGKGKMMEEVAPKGKGKSKAKSKGKGYDMYEYEPPAKSKGKGKKGPKGAPKGKAYDDWYGGDSYSYGGKPSKGGKGKDKGKGKGKKGGW